MKITFGKPQYNISLGIWTGIVIGVGGDEPTPTPTGATETYAIFDTLAAAQALLPDNHWDWVWAKDEDKWYRYNNVGEYEKYGIYAHSIEDYQRTIVEIPASIYTIEIVPTTTMRAEISGTLKSLANAHYYGYVRDDSKDYRFFWNSSVLYWDMNSSRASTYITAPSVGSSFNFEIGNNYAKGTFGRKEFNLTGSTQSSILDPRYMTINLEVLDIEHMYLYDGDELVFEIFKNEGKYYTYQNVGSTTYNGKIARVGEKEYKFEGNTWKYKGDTQICDITYSVDGVLSAVTSGDCVNIKFTSTTNSSGNIITYCEKESFEVPVTMYLKQRGYYTWATSKMQLSKPDGTAMETFSNTSDEKQSYTFEYNFENEGEYIAKLSQSYCDLSYCYLSLPTQYIDYYLRYDNVAEAPLFRAYPTLTASLQDNTKYGNSIIYTIDTDKYYTLSANGVYTDLVKHNSFIVVDDIASIKEPPYYMAYNRSDSSWYVVNNLGKYEQYGVFGSGLDITHYEGKLTIADSDEYKYSGNAWSVCVSPVDYEAIPDPDPKVEFASEAEQEAYSGKTYAGEVCLRTDTENIGVRTEEGNWDILTDEDRVFKYTTSDNKIYNTTKKTGWNNSGDTIINVYTDTTKGLVIADHKITKIPDRAFQSATTVNSITIPSSVTQLGSYAFERCKMTSVSIPSGVTSIPTQCFCYCSNILSLDLPYIKTIGDSGFQECPSLKKVSLNSFTGGGTGNWFYKCYGLHEVNFGSVYAGTYRDYQFYQCPVEKLTFTDAGSITNVTSLPFFATLQTLRVPNIKISFNLSACTAMTADAIVQVFNDLATVTDKTITVGETNLAKLTEEQIAIATAKGWTVS